jgi:hypothetical protein
MICQPFVANVDARGNLGLLATVPSGNWFCQAVPQETGHTSRVDVTVIDHQEAEEEVESVGLAEARSRVIIDFLKGLILGLSHDANFSSSPPKKIFELLIIRQWHNSNATKIRCEFTCQHSALLGVGL